MRTLAFRMAELADAHHVSTLGAEALAASREPRRALVRLVWRRRAWHPCRNDGARHGPPHRPTLSATSRRGFLTSDVTGSVGGADG